MSESSALWPKLGLSVALGVLLAMPLGVSAQDTGTIEGTVTDAETGEPLASVSVSVQETGLGTLTGADGTFEVENVPEGEHPVRVEVLGYGSQTQDVTVAAGEVATVEFELERAVVDVEEIVAIGVTEATERARVPFSVGRTGPEIMEVATPSAAQALQGQIAGVSVVQGSGRPGATPDILLRGPTSIDGAGRDQGPLVVVDGVITTTGLSDIDSRDIQDMEVVRGAAGATLYGSRAAQGVIEITTRGGQDAADGATNYSISTEFGVQDLESEFDLARTHPWQLNEDGTAFIDSDGNECILAGMSPDLPRCADFQMAGHLAGPDETPGPDNTFMVEEYPEIFDPVDQLFDPGNYLETHVAVEGRSGGTNYRASYSYLDEDGVIGPLDGFERHNFRVRLGQSITENLRMDGMAFISRSTDDDLSEFSGNPLFMLTRMPAGVDLTAEEEEGEFAGFPVRRPDPTEENQNPLIDLAYIDRAQERSRTMANVRLDYSPQDWLSLEGDVSYDRFDWSFSQWRDVGFPTSRPEVDNFNLGTIWKQTSSEEALNTSLNATARHTVGDLGLRLQGRYLYEEDRSEGRNISGTELAASGVPTLGNLDDPERVSRSSSVETIRSEGLFLGLNVDYRDRYIFDGMFRRDGSSLFGADERWQNYFRTAGVYRIGQEEFFDVDAIDELALRASIGTAGGRPNFAAQYETFSVGGGVISPGTLGNRDLRPEEALEQEFGAEVQFLGRYGAEVTYARSEVEDQIMRVPLPATFGFSQQWQNAGTVRSNTVEVTLNANLLERDDMRWTGRLSFDRTRQRITELDVPEFTYGVGGQNMGDIFFAREGESLGTFYGGIVPTQCSELDPEVRDFCDTHFDRNNDGILVPVGEGGTWRDERWGETVEIGGQDFDWGYPVTGVGIDPITGEESDFVPVGSTTPDFNISLAQTFTIGNLSLYGLLDWVEGVDVWNQPLQWATFDNYAGIMDDSGLPEEERKPVGYYEEVYNTFGLQPSNFWVQDASFIKLREVALRYRFTEDQVQRVPGLGAVQDIALSVTGRNLFTSTDYNGYDPEIGRGGGDVGSGALARVDGFQYPNFRTLTFGVEVNF